MGLPSSGFVDIQNLSIYFETGGEGEPLVLLHAGVADQRMWADNVAGLAAHYQVICYDMPGFGRTKLAEMTFSPHGVLASVLDHLGIEQAHIVGISYGGRVAIDFALAYPERVRKLVLGAPSVGGEEPSERMIAFWDEEDALLEAGDLAGATELNLRLWVDGIYRRPEVVNTAVRERVQQMQLGAFKIAWPDDLEQVGLKPLAIDRLGEVKAETMVIVGDLDLPEKLVLADRLAAEIPQARKAIIPNTAHMMSMEAPERFNQLVIDFLSNYEV